MEEHADVVLMLCRDGYYGLAGERCELFSGRGLRCGVSSWHGMLLRGAHVPLSTSPPGEAAQVRGFPLSPMGSEANLYTARLIVDDESAVQRASRDWERHVSFSMASRRLRVEILKGVFTLLCRWMC